jgi:hypothetical protein
MGVGWVARNSLQFAARNGGVSVAGNDPEALLLAHAHTSTVAA